MKIDVYGGFIQREMRCARVLRAKNCRTERDRMSPEFPLRNPVKGMEAM